MSAAVKAIFENQPSIINVERAAKLIGFARRTIYDMRLRPWEYEIHSPDKMFLKNGRHLRVVTNELKKWLISRMGDES